MDGISSRSIIRYSFTDRTFRPMGTGTVSEAGFPGTVNYLDTLPNGDLLVGGEFAQAGGVYSKNFVLYRNLVRTGPSAGSVCEHTPATLSVATTDDLGPLTYQWRRNGQAISAAQNASATTASLTINSVQRSDEGSYDCVVSAACGNTTSNSAMLRVSPAYSRTCGGPGCDGDLNADGSIDQGDLDYLVNAIAGGGNPLTIDTDFNQDGASDQTDVDALIGVVAGGDCP